MVMMPLATTLGDHYSALTLEQLPPEVVEKARLAVLDALGSAIGGWRTPTSRRIRQIGRALTNPTGTATMWADGTPATPLDAIFVNTAFVHSLLRDDSLPGTSTHGGSIIIPTTLALAEHGRATGARVLLGAIAAYDVQGRLGSRYGVSARVTGRGYRGTPVFGPLVGAAAASVVLELDAERFATALNLAANFSGGLLESMKYGTPEYRLQTANAARCGALAALSAECGIAAAPTTLDGTHGFFKVFADLDAPPAYVTSELGERYEILRVVHKPYPTCGNNIRVVQTLARAFAERSLAPDTVAQVKLRVHPHSKNYPGCDNPGPFETVDQALLSTQFAVAALLQYGELTAEAYKDLDSPLIADIAQRVLLVEDPTVGVGLLDCRAEVTLIDGTRFGANASSDDENIFHPARAAAVESFHDITRDVLPETQSDRIIELVLRLEDVGDIGQLTSLLRE